MVQFSDTLAAQLSATHEEPPKIGQGFNLNVGLLSMMDKTGLLSMLTTHGDVDAGCSRESPSVGGHGEPSLTVGDRERTWSTGGAGRIPCALTALLATREDTNGDLGDQRPPYKPPNLPNCYASFLKAHLSHSEAMQSEHGHLW